MLRSVEAARACARRPAKATTMSAKGPKKGLPVRSTNNKPAIEAVAMIIFRASASKNLFACSAATPSPSNQTLNTGRSALSASDCNSSSLGNTSFTKKVIHCSLAACTALLCVVFDCPEVQQGKVKVNAERNVRGNIAGAACCERASTCDGPVSAPDGSNTCSTPCPCNNCQAIAKGMLSRLRPAKLNAAAMLPGPAMTVGNL
mmetsp:Transcript_61600/g.177317  ORF Transcript_61600/g.177317 Transcript_61600/m.177317 type:complete len:203 (-) Transcript_61600:688-1296(-)